MARKIPVTVVGGFLGAGKTSLLHHWICEHTGGPLALLVENASSTNLDARALRGLCGAMGRRYDTVLEIPTGDDEAQVDWLASTLRELTETGRFERVIVELGGMANPARLGACFGLLPGQSNRLGENAELTHLICVVDALDFYRSVVSSSRYRTPNALLDFQHAQIEGASHIVLNKGDLIDDGERRACLRLLRLINPDAAVIETAYGEIPPAGWDTPGTLQQLGLAVERRLKPLANGETEEMSSPAPAWEGATYRAHYPFHPERFWNFFNDEHPGLLRLKGFVWLATRNPMVGGISRTRWQNACGCAGLWWASLSKDNWPEDDESREQIRHNWREPYGDRRQELVLVGDQSVIPGLVQQLNRCLLSEQEIALPIKAWSDFPDPFPAWDLAD